MSIPETTKPVATNSEIDYLKIGVFDIAVQTTDSGVVETSDEFTSDGGPKYETLTPGGV